MIYTLELNLNIYEDEALASAIDYLNNSKIEYAVEALDLTNADQDGNEIVVGQTICLSVIKKANDIDYLRKYAKIILSNTETKDVHEMLSTENTLYIDAVGING